MILQGIAYCTKCGELGRGANGTMMEGLAQLHKKDNPGHIVLLLATVANQEEKP